MPQRDKLLTVFFLPLHVCVMFRSGKDLDITSQRIAASNASLKELFVDALRLTKA